MLGTVCVQMRCSGIFETDPMYVLEQPRFLNAVASGLTDLAPRPLLDEIHAIESALGRDRSTEVRRGPRTLDVDLLLHGSLVSDDPDLTLPHPRIAERAFVLVPLLELAPELVDPRTGAPYAATLARLGRAGVYSQPAG